MTLGTAVFRSDRSKFTARDILSLLGVLVLVGAVIPPVLTWARRYEFVEAIQFCILAIVTPSLIVLGAPWRHRATPGAAAALAAARTRRRETWRSVTIVGVFVLVVVLWRTPVGVSAIVHHGWALLLEALILVPAGGALWLELVESRPLRPRLSRPHRVVVSAIAMWTCWIMAYLVGLSTSSWYPAFTHVSGRSLSIGADQQLTSGTMWIISGVAFVPLIFWNLVRWLQSEEDADDAMTRTMRFERSRAGAPTLSRPVAE